MEASSRSFKLFSMINHEVSMKKGGEGRGGGGEGRGGEGERGASVVSLSAGLRQDHDAQGAYLTPIPHPLTVSRPHSNTLSPPTPHLLTLSRPHSLCPVTPSRTHLVIPSPLHNVITLSHPHSRFHICTLPPTHTLTPSPSHTLTLSHPHPLTPSPSHPLASSPPHTRFTCTITSPSSSSLAPPSLPPGQSCPGVRL